MSDHVSESRLHSPLCLVLVSRVRERLSAHRGLIVALDTNGRVCTICSRLTLLLLLYILPNSLAD